MGTVKTFSVEAFIGFEQLAKIAECTGVQDSDVDALYEQWMVEHRLFLERRDELLSSSDGKNDIMNGSVFTYTLTDEKRIPRKFNIPRWAVRVFIQCLVHCKPVPVSGIRNEFVHGDCEYSGAYTTAEQAFIKLAVLISEPVIRQKVYGEESRIRGRDGVRVYAGSRQVGHKGSERLFSDSDITDIVDKVTLIVFCPLIVRTVPIQGRGAGYVVFEHCTTEQCESEWEERVMDKRSWKMQSVQRHGWTITFTDMLTGEKMSTNTDSHSRAVQLYEMSGIMGTVSTELAYTDDNDSGELLNPALYGYTPVSGELDSDSIVQFKHGRVFSSVLVGTIRTHFRAVYRRAIQDDAVGLITEHRKARAMRRTVNELQLFEIREQAKVDNSLNKYELDILTVELYTDDELKAVRLYTLERDRKWMAFCDERMNSTGEMFTVSRATYFRHRATLLKKLQTLYGSTEEKSGERVLRPFEETTKPTPLYELSVDKRTFPEVLAESFAYGVDRSTPFLPSANPIHWSNGYCCQLVQEYRRSRDGQFQRSANYGTKPQDYTPVQYQKHDEPTARYIAGVLSISGRPNTEQTSEHNPSKVVMDRMEVNGFTVPVWKMEVPEMVQITPIHKTTEQMPTVNGLAGDKIVHVNSGTPFFAASGKVSYQLYIDVLTSCGDGI